MAVHLNDPSDEELARRAFEVLVRELGVSHALRFMRQSMPSVPVAVTDAVREELNRLPLEDLHREIEGVERKHGRS